MQINRSRFLLMTSAIAAATGAAMVTGGGCSSTASDPGPGDASAQDADPGQDSGAGTPVDAGADSGSCLGDDGDPPNCDSLTATGCSSVCATYANRYKNAIARDVHACLMTLPTCEGNAMERAACVDAALGKACADPSAEAFCAPLVAACQGDAGADAGSDAGTDAGSDAGPPPTFSQSGCETLVRGLTATGRRQFTSCVTEGTAGYCSSNAPYCIEFLK